MSTEINNALGRALHDADAAARGAADAMGLVLVDQGDEAALGLASTAGTDQRHATIRGMAGEALDPRITPWQAQEALAHIGCFVPLADLAARDWTDRMLAFTWATEIHFSNQPGGGDPPEERPQWLPGRDIMMVDRSIVADWNAHGGAPEAYRIFGTDWTEPADPEQEAPTRTFLDELEELGDDDLIADLEGVGVQLMHRADENDNVKWQVFADRLLASAQATQATLDERLEAERLQHTMITNRYAETNATLHNQLARTLALAERIAEHLEYPKRAKSIKLPHGTIGYKDFAEKAKVVDADAALAWAEEHLPQAVLEFTVTKREVNKADVIAHATATPAPIPGVTKIPARREFYATPLDPESGR